MWIFSLPFDALSLQQSPYRTIGGSPVTVTLSLDVTALSSLSFLQILAFSRFGVLVGWISQKGERPKLLHSLKVAHPGPRQPLLGHTGAVQTTRLPPSLPPLLPPRVFIIPTPSVEELWGLWL